MNYTIGDLAEISKAATKKVAAEYQRYGWKNPPTVTIAMTEAVLEAAQQSVQPDGALPSEKLQRALDASKAMRKELRKKQPRR